MFFLLNGQYPELTITQKYSQTVSLNSQPLEGRKVAFVKDHLHVSYTDQQTHKTIFMCKII